MTVQALQLANCQMLHDVFAYALKFEAANQELQRHTSYINIHQIRSQTQEYRNRYQCLGHSRQ